MGPDVERLKELIRSQDSLEDAVVAPIHPEIRWAPTAKYVAMPASMSANSGTTPADLQSP
jgi:hypothetical protein